jgi:hypothetical protein
VSASVTISGNDPGGPAGPRTLGPITVPGSTEIDETFVEALASGDNTIIVPAGATGAVILPPATGTATLKLRTNQNSSDGGLVLSSTLPFTYTFPATPPTSLIINASAAETALTSVWFW